MSLVKANLVGQGTAEQEVLTPPSVIAIVEAAFGRSIALDPCSPSKHNPSFYAARRYTEADNGLILPWEDATFSNPPFSDLAPWLTKAVDEARKGHRIAVLGPWRAHRPWFRRDLATADVIDSFDLKFIGHKAKAPFPCFLAFWGCAPPRSMLKFPLQPLPPETP